MSQPDGVDVRPAELEAHATTVDRIAADIAMAYDMGASTTTSGDAYGKLCWQITLPLGMLQDVVTDAISAASESLGDGAERLRTAAAGYRRADADMAILHSQLYPE